MEYPENACIKLGREEFQRLKSCSEWLVYRVDGITYYVQAIWNLTAEEVASVYKLRWEIKKFFA